MANRINESRLSLNIFRRFTATWPVTILVKPGLVPLISVVGTLQLISRGKPILTCANSDGSLLRYTTSRLGSLHSGMHVRVCAVRHEYRHIVLAESRELQH